jgi:hypothetical protein
LRSDDEEEKGWPKELYDCDCAKLAKDQPIAGLCPADELLAVFGPVPVPELE